MSSNMLTTPTLPVFRRPVFAVEVDATVSPDRGPERRNKRQRRFERRLARRQQAAAVTGPQFGGDHDDLGATRP